MNTLIVLPLYVVVRNSMKALKIDNEYLSVFVSSVVAWELLKQHRKVNEPSKYRRPRAFRNVSAMAMEFAHS